MRHEGTDDMCEVSLLRQSPTFNFFHRFGKASQRVLQAMKHVVTCGTILESDDTFAEYLARIPRARTTDFPCDSQGLSPSACSITRDLNSSFRSDNSFFPYTASALRVSSPLRLQGGEDQIPSTSPEPLQECSSSKSGNSFAECEANATSQHDALDFRENQDAICSNCSMPRAACSSHPPEVDGNLGSPSGGVGGRGRSFSACSSPREATARGSGTPPNAWWNRKGGKSPVGFVGKLDANPSSRLAAICRSEKSQILERPERTEGPKLPANFFDLPIERRLRAIKQFLSDFEYRLNSLSNFQVKKQRPLSGLMATAKLIIHQPEPIKCVEAVFVALYLTAGLQSVERIPLGFKTQFANQVFHHIVLLVHHKGKYGAFGISRSPDLMNKDINYDSMSSIIEDFKGAYEESDHTILNLQIGLPVEHNILSSTFVCWEHVTLCPADQPWPECVAAIENHASRMKHLWNVWVISGRGADPTRIPLRVLRKPPLNNGLNTGVKPAAKKPSTLPKSSNRREEYQLPRCRPTSLYGASLKSTVTNKTHSQRPWKQRNAPVSVTKSLLKGFLNPSDCSGPWEYTQRPKHRHQRTVSGEIEEHAVIHLCECGSIEPHSLILEDCKLRDCGNLLRQADSQLLDGNPESRAPELLCNMGTSEIRSGLMHRFES